MNAQVLGIIPARSGSKGLPHKNTLPLGGKPLLSWVCEEATKTERIHEIVLSSDSHNAIAIAKSHGIRAPFIRPDELATDKTLIINVIAHALHWLKTNEKKTFDYVCLMQPTSPFAKAEDYDNAISLALQQNADTVITAYACGQDHPYVMYTMNEDRKASWLPKTLGWDQMARRQDAPTVYRRSGIAYVCSVKTISSGTLYGDRTFIYEVPHHRGSIDINTPLDMAIARTVLSDFPELYS
jgi:CMP-N-acetylneuraminic acid synthetase